MKPFGRKEESNYFSVFQLFLRLYASSKYAFASLAASMGVGRGGGRSTPCLFADSAGADS